MESYDELEEQEGVRWEERGETNVGSGIVYDTRAEMVDSDVALDEAGEGKEGVDADERWWNAEVDGRYWYPPR